MMEVYRWYWYLRADRRVEARGRDHRVHPGRMIDMLAANSGKVSALHHDDDRLHTELNINGEEVSCS